MIASGPGGLIVETDTVPAAMYLTTITLNRAHPDGIREQADVCAMHSRVIDITAGMPDEDPRVLWATPARDLLVVRTPEPVTMARLPAAYAESVSCRPWTMPQQPGRYRMVGVINPGRHARTGGPTLNQPDRPYVHLGPKLIDDPAEQADWLHRRLCSATAGDLAELPDAARVTGYRIARRWIGTGSHRTGRRIVVRQLAVACDVEVLDPAVVCQSVIGGIGIDKTWGSGLTIWEAA